MSPILMSPMLGFVIGLCLIMFKEKVSQFLRKVFEKFPKYEDGAKSLNMRFEVHPGYITILGLIFILIAIGGFLEIIRSRLG